MKSSKTTKLKLYALCLTLSATILTGCGDVKDESKTDSSTESASASTSETSSENSATESNSSTGDNSSTDETSSASSDPKAFSGDLLDNSVVNFMDICRELDKDVCVSPLSLNEAFGILYLGLGGDSQAEMNNYFKNSAEQVGTFYKGINKSYDGVEICNSFWINESNTCKGSYISSIKEYYDADSESLDFSDEKSADVINNFVAEKTHDKIPKIIDPDTLKNSSNVIINTLYFNNKWCSYFKKDNTSKKEFTEDDGNKVKVDMMRGSAESYYENSNAVAFGKKYQNGMTFIGILPNDSSMSLKDVDIKDLFNHKNTEVDVTVEMPKFEKSYSSDLTEKTKKMGFSNIYSDEADFSNMTDEPTKVAKIVQKTYIKVDEEGTEAAAATAIYDAINGIIVEEKEVKEVILNRPFYYLIMDEMNGEVFFVGRVDTL